MASDLAVKVTQAAFMRVSHLKLPLYQWKQVEELVLWAVDEALNEVVGEDNSGELCNTTYSVLDELHDQLTESAQHIELATETGRESAAILIADLGSVDRVRKLIREIVDPGTV